MQNLIIAKRNKVTLSGNKLSGDTYSAKQYIKTYLDGKWDAMSKSWTVNTAKVADLIARNAIVIDTAPIADTSKISYNYVTSDGSLAEDY